MSTLVTGTIKSNTANPPFFQNTSGTEIGTLCRAWVNFNGVTTITIRASYNVSSVVRNSAGNYTVNLTTAMLDANYSHVVSVTTPAGYNTVGATAAPASSSASSIGVVGIIGTSNVAADAATVSVGVFR